MPSGSLSAEGDSFLARIISSHCRVSLSLTRKAEENIAERLLYAGGSYNYFLSFFMSVPWALFSFSGKNSAMVCLFCILPTQNSRSHASSGTEIMPNKSAIKRFPASPGPAVKAEMTNAVTSNTIAASAAMAMSCLGDFFMIQYLTFLRVF